MTVSHEETQWINVICFGETAEKIAEIARKGDRVYVEGSLTLATWETGEGNTRSGLAVSALKVEKLGNIGRNCLKQEELPIALPAKKKLKRRFDLFRKNAKAETVAIDPEFNDEIPF